MLKTKSILNSLLTCFVGSFIPYVYSLEQNWSLNVNWYENCPCSYQFHPVKQKCVNLGSFDYNNPNTTASAQGALFNRAVIKY